MQNVLTKFKWMTDQKNTLVFVLIVRWLWKLFRLPKQCLHWCNGAKKHWMTFPPTILWDSSGSPRNETTDEITKEGTVHQFAGPEPTLGVSRQITTRRIKCWIDDWHMAIWRVLTSIQTQARKLILGPSPIARARLLSFNRMQSRAVTGLLTGYNTPRRHLYIMG